MFSIRARIAAEIEAFLTHLAKTDVSASTQNQALQAILFMYREMFDRKFENIQAVRAKGTTRIPAVLTVDETKRVLCRLQGVHHIIGYLLYGAGLRLVEGLQLRVKDVDFELHTITLHETKSNRDRVTVLPKAVEEPLRLHLAKVKAQHEEDLERWRGNIQGQNTNGAGNICFRLFIYPAIHGVVSSGDII